MIPIAVLIVVALCLAMIRKIPEGERGVVFRFGKSLSHVKRPGFVLVVPFVDKLRRLPAGDFSVSLPPQSSITKDEHPIQLQASLDASLADPRTAALNAADWRLLLISSLQQLLKDRLEDFDEVSLRNDFPQWVQAIRLEMDTRASGLGVKIKDLRISNLSPP